MKNLLADTGRRYPWLWLALSVAITSFVAIFSPVAQGATTSVSIQDNIFVPSSVTINQGDSVQWTWDGLNLHSSTSTSTPALWDSGVVGHGSTFTHTFPTAGSFPYKCSNHLLLGQIGSVTVQAAANVPPSISISSPTNGTVFSAPWTGAIQAATSDPDDTVSKVDFYNGITLLGTVSNPPANLSLHLTNMSAGTYTVKAVATDSRGATNQTGTVTFQVLAPAAITLSAPERLSSSSFRFLYTATPGLNYVVQRSSALPGFTSISTNAATTNHVTFTDTTANAPFNTYSVKLLPNP